MAIVSALLAGGDRHRIVPPLTQAHQQAALNSSLSTSATDKSSAPASSMTGVVQEYCVRCHNDRRLRGDLSLESFSVENAAIEADVSERMIRKGRDDATSRSSTSRRG